MLTRKDDADDGAELERCGQVSTPSFSSETEGAPDEGFGCCGMKAEREG